MLYEYSLKLLIFISSKRDKYQQKLYEYIAVGLEILRHSTDKYQQILYEYKKNLGVTS